MPLLENLKKIIKMLFSEPEKTVVYGADEKKEPEKFVSIWDYLQFRENTQAIHLFKSYWF